MIRPEIVRHATAADVLRAFIAPMLADTGEEDPRAVGLGCVTASGEEDAVSFDDALAGVVEMGLWGFADLRGRRLHFWASGTEELTARLSFFGHELGHFMEDAPNPDGDMADEIAANRYGEVAMLAYELAMEVSR